MLSNAEIVIQINNSLNSRRILGENSAIYINKSREIPTTDICHFANISMPLSRTLMRSTCSKAELMLYGSAVYPYFSLMSNFIIPECYLYC